MIGVCVDAVVMTDSSMWPPTRRTSQVEWLCHGARALRVWILVLGADGAPTSRVGKVARGAVTLVSLVVWSPVLALLQAIDDLVRGWVRQEVGWWW